MSKPTHNPVTIDAPPRLPFIEIVREFEHPVEQVFEAFRDPAVVARWLGPRGYQMQVDEWEFVSGGRYRYTHVTPEGDSFGFRGTFHTVREPELVVQTFEFEGVPDVVSIETMTLAALDRGRSRVTGHSTYPSVEARDGMISSGMEKGVVEGYERLDEHLEGGSSESTGPDASRPMDWTLEVVIVPVSDLAASIAFYRDQVGFPLDHHTVNEHMEVVQFTPRGSGCSIVIGSLPSQNEMAPGSLKGLQLVVADAAAARAELVERGVACSELMSFTPEDGGTFFGFSDPDGNSWSVQQLRVRAESPLIPLDARGRFGA